MQESTIITLYKEGKKDYSILGSYYLIILKNSLAKLIKKVLTIVINNNNNNKSIYNVCWVLKDL